MGPPTLSVGFGEVDITPSKPIRMAGYYYDRVSSSVHDPLRARAMAVSDGANRAVLCVADVVYLDESVVQAARRIVSERSGLPPDCLLLSCVHTHTGPIFLNLTGQPLRPEEQEYAVALPAKLADAVRLALDDLQPASFRAARGEEPTVQFIRRYRMKDGSVQTNPGILNPDVVEPIGTPDRDVIALLASRNGRPVGGLVNFGLHCDTVGGTEISADWTYYLRERARAALGKDLDLLAPIGCCGDVNHWNVFEKMEARGFDLTREIGEKIADAALVALEDAKAVEPGPVRALRKRIEVKTRMPSDEELEEAKAILAEKPPEGVDFTMDRVHAARKVKAAGMGPTQELDVSALTFGDVALVGVPAEYFSELGRDIKSRSPFAHTAVVTMAERVIGYVGERRNYDEGGYETASSVVVPGTGEQIADTAVELLNAAKGAK